MISDADMQEFVRELTRTLSRKSMGTGGGGSTDDNSPSDRAKQAKDDKILKDNVSAMKYLKNTLSKNNELLNESNHVSQASSKIFKQAVASADGLKGLEKLPSHFQKAMTQSNSMFVKKMGENLESVEDMYKSQQKIQDLPQIRSLLNSVAKGNASLLTLGYRIEELGFSVEEADMIVGKFDKDLFKASNGIIKSKQATNVAMQTVKQFDEEISAANKGIVRFTESVEDSDGTLANFKKTVGAMTVALGKELYDAGTASMRFGSEINLVQSRLSGMAPEEFSEMQARNRQAINALTGGFDEFNSIVGESRSEMLLYTGSLKAATELGASIITTSRLMGNSAVDTESFVKSQQNAFKSFNRQLSMTSDEFAAMNERLIQDSSIRGILYRQSGQERQAHFVGIQQQIKTYRTWGLLQEQAEELAKTMDRLAGKDAKTRMKEAAKLRAVMGAAGMGAEGARAQELMMMGSRRDATQTQELASILKSANEVIADKMGGSFQGELLAGQMIAKAGLEEYLGPNSVMVNSLLGKGAAGEGDPKATFAGQFGEVGTSIVQAITEGVATIISFLGSPFIAGLVTALGAFSLGKGFKVLKNMGRAIGDTYKSVKSVVGKGVQYGSKAVQAGKSVLGAAGPTAGVLAAGAGGYAVGTGINKALEKWAPDYHREMQDNIGGTISNIIDKSFSEVVDNTMGYWGDQLSSIMGDDVETEAEKQAKKAEEKRVEDALQLQDALKELTNAVMEGNKDRIVAAKANVTAINNQTETQKDSDEKAMEQGKTKQRQAYFAVP